MCLQIQKLKTGLTGKFYVGSSVVKEISIWSGYIWKNSFEYLSCSRQMLRQIEK